MKIICEYKAEKAPPCSVEHIMGAFTFCQDDETIAMSAQQSRELIDGLVRIETWLKEAVENDRLTDEYVNKTSPQFSIKADDEFEPVDVRVRNEDDAPIGLCVEMTTPDKKRIAFDLEGCWGIRAFMIEALFQEDAGVYSWG